jgi:Ca2+:H+ antiporter
LLIRGGLDPTAARHATATLIAFLVINGGRSAWFVGAPVVMVYLIFALTLYLVPPPVQ